MRCPSAIRNAGRAFVLLSLSLASLASPLVSQVQAPAQPATQTGGKKLTLDGVLKNPRQYFAQLPPTQWLPGTQQFSMPKPMDRGQTIVAYGAHGGSKPLFDLAKIKTALQKAGMPGAARMQRTPLNFTWVNKETIRLQRPDGVYHWKLSEEAAAKKLSFPAGAGAIACSKNDRRAAYLLRNQLFVQQGTDRFAVITKDGSNDIVYGGAAHRAEFGIHDGLWWGPNERYLAFYREDLTPIQRYPYADHTVMPPKILHGRYPMAGQVHSHVKVGIHDTKTNKTYYLEEQFFAHGTDRRPRDVYWTNVTFGPKGHNIYVAIVNRDQNHMDLVEFSLADGMRKQILFSEDDKKWIEPEHGPIFLPDKSGSFLWFSPRDGFRHLYHYRAGGDLIGQVTRGKFDVREFVGFVKPESANTDGPVLFHVMASGDDPLQMHLWEVNLMGGEMTKRTKVKGWHSCQVSDNGQFVLDRYSNLETPAALLGLGPDGKVMQRLVAPNLIQNLPSQEFLTVTADDGQKLHGHLFLPPNLDPRKKYPVLLYVYGGPHSQLVRNSFLGGGNLWLAYMASRGFLVMRVDNRGTDNRGIQFSQSVFRKLSHLEVADQLAAVAELKKRPYVDGNRIGVHGWSYGGYMTLSLMLRAPDTFACGISGAPVTDWAQYETGYTERYMDTPQQNGRGYRRSSVIPLAKKLKGRLLIVHGTDDRTVMWSHSLAFVDRCIAEGVLVDYMPYPMQKHGVRGRDRQHLYKLMTRFFVDHLKPR